MRLLLDTHIALWAISDDPKLSSAGRVLVTNPDNVIMVSAVAFLEIAVKRARRAHALSISAEKALELCLTAGFELLSVSPRHAAAVESLPLLHGDPFDRLLVAQALVEPLRLVTHDKRAASYSDSFILV